MASENDFRLVGVVNCYGTGTRSYNRSAEKREMDRQRKAATEAFLNGPREEVVLRLTCTCRSFHYPHNLSAHRKLRSEMDWRTADERELNRDMERAIEYDTYVEELAEQLAKMAEQLAKKGESEKRRTIHLQRADA